MDKIKKNKVFLIQVICGVVFILLGIIQVMRHKVIGFFEVGYILIGMMYIITAIKTSKV